VRSDRAGRAQDETAAGFPFQDFHPGVGFDGPDIPFDKNATPDGLLRLNQLGITQGRRIFFNDERRLLADLCRCTLLALIRYFEVVTGSALTPGVIAAINYRAEDGLLIRAKRSARFVR
jgi:hypothetical protein